MLPLYSPRLESPATEGSAPSWVGELFVRIAVPRLPGSSALREVEHAICQRLSALGYEIRRQRFTASARRLAAVSLAGAGLGWSTLALVPLLIVPLPGWSVTLVGLAALGLVFTLAVGVSQGHLRLGAANVDALNISATRGKPGLWLVAHADSKGQRLSLRARVIGTACAVVGSGGLLLSLVIRLAAPLPVWTVVPIALAALTGGAVLSMSAARRDSPGAVDNATGVIAALVAADLLRTRTDIGILITGAEEYAMEGARAWVRTRSRSGLFVNFDGLDSRGVYRVMEHRARSASGSGPSARDVQEALVAELRARGCIALRRRLPLGVLVDGIVLAAAGMIGVTVSRGDWQSLGVVHTTRDVAARVDILAAVEVGQAAAAMAARLLG